MFFHNSAVKMRDVTDGASNTLILGERTTFQDPVNGPYYGTWSGALPGVDDASGRFMGHAGDVPNIANDIEDFGSFHVGGAHFVMADGHVVFISENIQLSVFEALGTRNGGEVVGQY